MSKEKELKFEVIYRVETTYKAVVYAGSKEESWRITQDEQFGQFDEVEEIESDCTGVR